MRRLLRQMCIIMLYLMVSLVLSLLLLMLFHQIYLCNSTYLFCEMHILACMTVLTCSHMFRGLFETTV